MLDVQIEGYLNRVTYFWKVWLSSLVSLLGLPWPLAHLWAALTDLFYCRWSHTDSRQGKAQRTASLDEAEQIFVEALLAHLCGMVGHFERNLHACSDIAFFRADGEMRLKFSDIPFKPFSKTKGNKEDSLLVSWGCPQCCGEQETLPGLLTWRFVSLWTPWNLGGEGWPNKAEAGGDKGQVTPGYTDWAPSQS